MTVHILCTCLNPDLLEYSKLVFKTIRVGFPTADVHVWFNGNSQFEADIKSLCEEGGYKYTTDLRTSHHAWIQKLCEDELVPFWICDTDIIFYDSVENLQSDWSITGWLIPEWQDEFTKCITRSRIHTCLMRIDPLQLRTDIDKYHSSVTRIPFINPSVSLYAPVVVPFNERSYFYDVTSLLYHAVGGGYFTDSIKDKFFHFNFGTIEDIVLPHLENGGKMKTARGMVLAHPSLGYRAWEVQEEYYRSRQPKFDGEFVTDTMSPEDIKLAQAWNREMCQNDPNAMLFCDLWHKYCHAIDDLIDTMEDGRPIMSKDQIIGTFLHAAILYNNAFFIANRTLLFPIVIDITNVYMMSVQWEKAPEKHLRKMGDVFRTCGNRMYSMVALICGGEEHMRVMSRKITERDYLSQHDSNDQPI